GKSASADAPQTATMYQDRVLAERRDACERDSVIPLLELSGHDRVLDVGCGYGRWAEALQGKIGAYLGIDFSAELLKLAEARKFAGATFQCMGAQDITPENVAVPPPFDLFICSGILIYLNDSDVTKLATAIAAMSIPGARVYLREPMAITGSRLTLDRFPSQELKRDYSAVYRTPEECHALFGDPLRSVGFTCSVERFLYPPELCNRKETEQQIQLWVRKA
ncbi:MAG TPA: methyltransferase domain-containing protein, partial [Opitutales bacterium]|nr:methyltransferase domain-containing protein [Opitutales bacterium]